MGLTPEAKKTDHGFGAIREPAEDQAEEDKSPAPEAPEQADGGNFSDMPLSELMVTEDPSGSRMSATPNVPEAEAQPEEEPPQPSKEEGAPAAPTSGEQEPPAPEVTEIPEHDPEQDSPPPQWREVTPIPLDELDSPLPEKEGPPHHEQPDEQEPPGELPSDPALEGWKSWPGRQGNEVHIAEEVSEEEAAAREAAVARQAKEAAEAEQEAAKLEAARFAPPPDESLPGLLLPNLASPRPLGNLTPVSYGDARVPGRGVMMDWRGYPSRIIDHFLETEGRGIIYLVLGLLLTGLAVTGWLHRDTMVVATGIDLEERRVVISVHTEPVDAALYLEGELVRRGGGKPGRLLLVPSAQERFIRVQAPGFVGKRVRFFADQDRELEVKLGLK